MWWVEAGALVAGGLVGWLTSWWFERRALRTAQEENAALEAEMQRLQAELSQMRATVLSLGGTSAVPRQRDDEGDLDQQVLARMRAVQDPGGRVPLSRLTTHFVGDGLSAADVSAAIDSLVARGHAQRADDDVLVL